MNHSDEDILKGCREGHSWAVRAISDFITPHIQRGVFSFDGWEDVRQDCLVKILAAVQRTQEVRNLWGLARRITACSVIDYNRKLRVESRTLVREPELPNTAGDLPDTAAPGSMSNPVSAYESTEFFLYVFQRLGTTCRKIIDGLFIRGLSYEELSEELHLSRGNLRVRLKRCRDEARRIRGEMEAKSVCS